MAKSGRETGRTGDGENNRRSLRINDAVYGNRQTARSHLYKTDYRLWPLSILRACDNEYLHYLNRQHPLSRI
ncbi:MAG: hypothetical protein A2W28_12195 [Gammaproteobacteria bacterium RBG_16_51_14]|nr:MAG: hypothetical protein A2W28_12195 [Gammaproteobacteria bacterium RBG_16_51_14]